jgi:long-chain acyl-CoA synthetase
VNAATENVLSDKQTLPDLLRESIRHFAERPLFGTKADGEWKWTSYQDFGGMVAAAARRLGEMGVKRGDRVAVIAPNCVEFAVCMYAAFERGAAIVAMYEHQTDKDWQYILRDSGAKVAFVDSPEIRNRIKAFAPDIAVTVWTRGDERWKPAPGHVVALPQRLTAQCEFVTASDVATVIYTSGTTGEPKGVPLTHRNICANVNVIRRLFPLGPDDRSLSFLPWAHVFGQVLETHSIISLGASAAICEGTDKIVANLAEVQPTILFSVPRIYDRIYASVNKQMAEKPAVIKALFRTGLEAAARKAQGSDLSLGDRITLRLADRLIFSKIRRKFGGRLRFAISGGASLAKEVGTFIDALGISVYEAYGLTETCCVSTNVPGDRKMGGVGKVIPGVRVTIDFTATDDPSHGEIIVYGPSILRGYLNRPDAVSDGIGLDGGFRTGDLGRFDADGHLFITGRKKDQYKLANGKYVAPAPLEDKLKLSPLITNVMVYGDNRDCNVALIVPDRAALSSALSEQGMDISLGRLNDDMRVRTLYATELERHSDGFDKFERIRSFALLDEDFTLDNGLLTPTFKVKRQAVVKRYADQIAALYGK